MATPIRVWHPKCLPAPVEHFYPIEEIKGTYGATVKKLLENGDIILIEHDVDPTPEQVMSLQSAAQEYPGAVWAHRYWLHPITTALDKPVCAHRPRFGEWLTEEGTVQIQYFALGCTYLPQSVGACIEPEWDYPALDFLISKAWHDVGGRAYASPHWVEHLHR